MLPTYKLALHSSLLLCLPWYLLKLFPLHVSTFLIFPPQTRPPNFSFSVIIDAAIPQINALPHPQHHWLHASFSLNLWEPPLNCFLLSILQQPIDQVFYFSKILLFLKYLNQLHPAFLWAPFLFSTDYANFLHPSCHHLCQLLFQHKFFLQLSKL